MSLVVDGIILLSSQVVFFLGSWSFFLYKIFRDNEVKHFSVVILFSLTFALSCTLFELIIFEILDILSKDSRHFHWKFVLALMVLLIVVVIPLHMSYSLVHSLPFLASPLRLALATFLWALLFVLFWKVGNPFPFISKTSGFFSFEQAVGRVAIIGVAVIALLSGVGAVNYTSLFCFSNRVEEGDLEFCRNRLMDTLNLVINKKRRLLLLEERDRGGFFGNIFENREMGELERDIELFEDSFDRFYLEYRDLSHQHTIQSNTYRGMYFRTRGVFFAIYCCWKIVITSANILLKRAGGVDPVTNGVGFLVAYISVDLDVKLWAQQLSFLAVGVLAVSSVRGLLLNLEKFFTGAVNEGRSSDIVLLVMAEIMGMYFVSSVLLMRSTMPPQYRTIITNVLVHLRFDFYQRWFDIIFLVSALVTFLCVFIKRDAQKYMDIRTTS